MQGVSRAKRRVEFLPLGVVEEEIETLFGVELRVVASLRTNGKVFDKILFPDDLAAAVTLFPETLGFEVSLVFGFGSKARSFSGPPGHSY